MPISGYGKGVEPAVGKVITAVRRLRRLSGSSTTCRGQEVDFKKAITASMILVGLRFLLTFPPAVSAYLRLIDYSAIGVPAGTLPPGTASPTHS